MNRVTQEEIDALEKAADQAYEDGDRAHYDALMASARFKRRQLREQRAGVRGSVAVFIE